MIPGTRRHLIVTEPGVAIVRQPAMFVTGSRDPARNQPAIERLPELVANLRVLARLDGCGHWTQQERPADVTALILQFLASLARR
jgi:pimeloyl-ACP methyl ester carboxylesterase